MKNKSQAYFGALCWALAFFASTAAAQEVFQENGRYGLKDYNGETLLPPKYFQILGISGAYLYSTEDTDPKFAAKNGETIKPWGFPEAPSFAEFEFDPRLKYGYVGENIDSYKTEAVYKKILPQENGVLVNDGAFWFFLDGKNLKPIKKTLSDEIIPVVSSENGAFLNKKSGKYGVIDSNLKQAVKPIYDEIRFLGYMMVVKKDGKYHFMYEELWKLTKYPKEWIDEFYVDTVDGKAFDQWRARVGNKYGLVEIGEGSWIIPPIYDAVEQLQGYDYKVKRNGKYGVANGGSIEPEDDYFPYDSLGEVFGNDYVVAHRNGEHGILNFKTNEMALGFGYLMHDPASSQAEGDFSTYHYVEIKKDGKIGLYSTQTNKIVLPAEYEAYIDLGEPGSFAKHGKNLLVKKDGLWGAILPGFSATLPFEHNEILPELLYGQYLIAKKGNFWGLYDLKNPAKNLPFEFESFENIGYEYLKTKKGGLFGLRKFEGLTLLANEEWDEIKPADNGQAAVRKDGKTGMLNYATGKALFLKGMSETFPLKWQTEIGLSTFRTNLMTAKGLLLAGSNGLDRKAGKDAKDGLYLIDPKNGAVKQILAQGGQEGDFDVNGVAVSGNSLYFGNDEGMAFCFDFLGNKIWSKQLSGDIEGSPALGDFNNDKQDDAIFATEAGELLALDGQTGTTIWSFKSAREGYYTATPALYDLNGDGTEDVLIGLGGGKYMHAVNGKTGKLLWEFSTVSTAGFVNGSAVHASATVFLETGKEPLVVSPECYGSVHFLDKNGKWIKYFGTTIGLFSTPVFSPSGYAVSGASWMGSGNVDIAHLNGANAWAKDENGVLYLEKNQYKDGAACGPVSASAFLADVLSKGSPQFGICDENGFFQLISDKGEVLEVLSLPAGAEASPFVGDIDGDGLLEIVVSCLDGKLYCYGTQSKAKALWGQFRGENKNKGHFRWK